MEQPLAGPILFVSPVRQDQAALRRIVRRAHRAIPAASCRQALKRLDQGEVSVVLCDRDLPDGSWRDILHRIVDSAKPPLLIVTSRLADERLWAEVLNLGGFDVISKPFHSSEVLHVLETACGHRQSPARSSHFAGGA